MREKLKRALFNLDRVSKIPLEELKVKDGELIFAPRLFAPFRAIDPSVIEALQHSLKTIKTQIIKIQAMETGTKEEQKLAKEAFAVIERFNSAVTKRPEKRPTFSSFLFPRQEIPFHPIPYPKLYPTPTASPEKVEKTFWNSLSTLDLRVQDLFIMKALQLVGDYLPSRQAALKLIRSTPCQSSFDPKKSLLWMSQEMVLWPGLTLFIKGAFKRDPETGIFSLPVLESFDAAHLNSQAGFPFPQEYTGASLSFPLIPFYPHHLEKLPLVKMALKAKEKLTAELKPKGKLVPSLLTHLEQSKAAIEQNRQEWLQLHLDLCLHIVENSPQGTDKVKACVVDFFQELLEEKNAFEILSKAYLEFNQTTLVLPYRRVQEAWIEDALPKETTACQKEVLRLLTPLTKEFQVTNFEKFVHALQTLFLPSFQKILIHYLGESLPVQADALDLFSEKVLAWAFRQQMLFAEALENPAKERWMQMKSSLILDCELFASNQVLDPVVLELKSYFEAETA